MVPTRLCFSKQLRIAEALVDLVSNPTDAFLEALKDRAYLGKGFMSLLLLYRLNPALRANFDAIMTVSGIDLEGPWKIVKVGGHEVKRRDDSKPDPDRWKRRKLRKLQQNLQAKHLLHHETPRFLNPGSQVADSVLQDVPAEGLICFSGEYTYVKRAPEGQVGHVYGLAIPRVTLSQRGVLQETLAFQVDSRVADICMSETARVRAALTKRCNSCKLDRARVNFMAWNEIDHRSVGISFVSSVFASCSQSRDIVKELKAILPVFHTDN